MSFQTQSPFFKSRSDHLLFPAPIYNLYFQSKLNVIGIKFLLLLQAQR